jgi:hypothetical protein
VLLLAAVCAAALASAEDAASNDTHPHAPPPPAPPPVLPALSSCATVECRLRRALLAFTLLFALSCALNAVLCGFVWYQRRCCRTWCAQAALRGMRCVCRIACCCARLTALPPSCSVLCVTLRAPLAASTARISRRGSPRRRCAASAAGASGTCAGGGPIWCAKSDAHRAMRAHTPLLARIAPCGTRRAAPAPDARRWLPWSASKNAAAAPARPCAQAHRSVCVARALLLRCADALAARFCAAGCADAGRSASGWWCRRRAL